jgi:hypothetical protein
MSASPKNAKTFGQVGVFIGVIERDYSTGASPRPGSPTPPRDEL